MNISELLQLNQNKSTTMYVPALESKMAWMENLCGGIVKDRKRCFVFLDQKEDAVIVQVYVWFFEQHKNRESYVRYVLAPGLRMSVEELHSFELFCHEKEVIVDRRAFEKVYQVIDKTYPQLHLINYRNRLLMLHHIYHAFNHGIKELLYKAGLPSLAFEFDKIEDYNLLGTTPTQVMEVPLGVLRCLDSTFGIRVLQKYEQRIFLNLVYEKHSKLFRQEWTLPQCLYYINIICGKNDYYCEPNDIAAMEFLKKYYFEMEYSDFISYKEKHQLICEMLEIPYGMDELTNLEDIEDVESLYYKTDYVYHMLLEDKYYFDYELLKQRRKWKHLEYEDENYTVRLPYSMTEIYRESLKLRNCLWSYMWSIAEGASVVLFLREKTNPYLPFVDIELNGNCIVEVRKKYNQRVESPIEQWIRGYANRKELRWEVDALEELEIEDDFF